MERIECITFTRDAFDLNAFCEGVVLKVENTVINGYNKKLFIIDLDIIGENDVANAFLRDQMTLYKQGLSTAFSNTIAALIVVSSDECYTKSYAKKFIFIANQMGCEFIGHPLVERVKDYQNFKTWAKVINEPLEAIEKIQISKLIERLATYTFLAKESMKILVLHAGHKGISNTLMLWDMIKERLITKNSETLIIEELHVEEGNITDCYGCSFETCSYYSLEKSCFYGGFVVESLFPMIEQADIVVWICPNYNDAISAKLMAVINRLTALYRKISFQDKYILGIVVSGNSGNDSVSGQLIGALHINKGFRLPPNFVSMAIANDPGDILQVEDLDSRINDYVNIVHELTNKNMSKS
jgi:multimeric flavodoxin WrbA